MVLPKEAFFVDEGLSGIIMGHQAHYPGKEHTNYSLYMKHGFGGKFELGTIHVATRPTGELTMTIADMGEHPKPWGMLLIRMGRDQKEIQEPGMKKKRPGGERE